MKKLKYLLAFFMIVLASKSFAMLNFNPFDDDNRNMMHEGYNLSLIWDLKKDEKEFFTAVLDDNVKKINELLAEGVNIDVKDGFGQSALIAGITSNSLNAIQFLVNQGIDVNSKDISQFTPIHKIVLNEISEHEESNLDDLKILLAQNALYDIKNTIDNETALSLASNDKAMKSIFDEIIAYKKSVEKDQKEAALVNAITHNGKDDSQFTKEQWLRLALLRKDYKQLLYAFDKKFDKKDILTLVASVPSMPLDFIYSLVDKETVDKANITSKNFKNMPLKRIPPKTKRKIIPLKEDSFFAGRAKTRPETEEMLNGEEQDFFKAVHNNDVEKIDKLLKKGVNINVKDYIGQSALMTGVESNSLKAIQFLVNQGIDVDTKDKLQDTLLYQIVSQNEKSTLGALKILLAQNALYDIKTNPYHETAWSYASKNTAIEPIFDEIVAYKSSVEKDQKEAALVNAITHNGKDDSQFTKEQWLRLALLRKDNKQLLYAFDKKFDKKDILTLIVTVPSMPLDFISPLMYEGKITFDDLKPYYGIAKKENNKKFGKYYLDLQSNIKIHKIKKLPENVLEKINSFLQND